jgi:hypothetical protein
MAYPHIKKTQGKDFNFFNKIEVNWSQFGAPDGYTVEDGYGPDLIIPFSTQTVMFINEGAGTVEYSFNGNTIHGELDSTKASAALSFDNRVISTIWFRIKSGSSGPINISVHAWGIR